MINSQSVDNHPSCSLLFSARNRLANSPLPAPCLPTRVCQLDVLQDAPKFACLLLSLSLSLSLLLDVGGIGANMFGVSQPQASAASHNPVR